MMKNKKAVTLHYQLGNEREFLKKVFKDNKKVTIYRTNYSMKVVTERRSYMFSNKSTSKKAFGGYNKILKDIKSRNLATPDLDASDVKYWWFSDIEKYPKDFYSVDINSAYPTCLRNVGAISEETYDYLQNKLPKIDRLRCVGMLATQKGVFHYEDGELVDFEVDKSDTSGWFFLCCMITGQIMDLCKQRYADKVLYYWVDGIALKGDPTDCLMYIEYLGYQSKVETITECRKKDNWLIYLKDGKKKYLHLPKKVEVNDDELRRFLVHGNAE